MFSNIIGGNSGRIRESPERYGVATPGVKIVVKGAIKGWTNTRLPEWP